MPKRHDGGHEARYVYGHKRSDGTFSASKGPGGAHQRKGCGKAALILVALPLGLVVSLAWLVSLAVR